MQKVTSHSIRELTVTLSSSLDSSRTSLRESVQSLQSSILQSTGQVISPQGLLLDLLPRRCNVRHRFLSEILPMMKWKMNWEFENWIRIEFVVKASPRCCAFAWQASTALWHQLSSTPVLHWSPAAHGAHRPTSPASPLTSERWKKICKSYIYICLYTYTFFICKYNIVSII